MSLALFACLGWGIADFLGGLKSRVLSVIAVLTLSSWIGFALLLSIVGIRGTAPPQNPLLLMAVVGGALGMVALLLLYRGLAVGSMAIVAPISATGVILPVLAGLAMGDSPSLFQSLGMASAFSGAVLASREKDADGKGKRIAAGAGLAVGAAVAIGFFFIVMDRASDADPYWAALLMRFSTCIFLLPVVLVRRPSLRIGKPHLPAILAIGCIDAMAGVTWAVASTRGMLSVVSVVGALYPAVTVMMAALILKERPQNEQLIGVALAILGITLISAG